jgi:hypothetical protein
MLQNISCVTSVTCDNDDMYVKIFSRILDSSIADDPKLRHFFMDLLLLSDPEGNVIMTPSAIANRTRAELREVEWGLKELQKPEAVSLSPAEEGRRIVPLEGHGYGWRIVNYQQYRDYKTAKEMREASAERVRRWREKHGKSNPNKRHPTNGALTGEAAALAAERHGHTKGYDSIAAKRKGT